MMRCRPGVGTRDKHTRNKKARVQDIVTRHKEKKRENTTGTTLESLYTMVKTEGDKIKY